MKKVIAESKDFGDFLRNERQAQFMSQLTLAKEAGTTQAGEWTAKPAPGNDGKARERTRIQAGDRRGG